MRVVLAISELPTVPAVYAMYGGEDRPYLAYVGIGENLRQRITQHLVNRNSSATPDVGAVRLRITSARLSGGSTPASPIRSDAKPPSLLLFMCSNPRCAVAAGLRPAGSSERLMRAFETR